MDDLWDETDVPYDHPLLGQRVRVRLDDDGEYWITGELVQLTYGGDVDIRERDGRMRYAWPALEIVALE